MNLYCFFFGRYSHSSHLILLNQHFLGGKVYYNLSNHLATGYKFLNIASSLPTDAKGSYLPRVPTLVISPFISSHTVF